eukprot:CAMPEP_0202469388 /NCGR_PEP_ID=MMETSP1360-20130828/78378_1 /ASSEMBLY_ACC=CAM_ASM_000848 /TAXON_ID=515479 /ORGANISM="Licmophora paradoxa, Strain CCMP2313" /LENGTH=61 /DNA_ID=CAMNT_0049094721 /DNA_START=292 /DNA_END=477 /DNA_ORIENTATION=+
MSAPNPKTLLIQSPIVRRGFPAAPWLASCCTLRPMEAWLRPHMSARGREDPRVIQKKRQVP